MSFLIPGAAGGLIRFIWMWHNHRYKTDLWARAFRDIGAGALNIGPPEGYGVPLLRDLASAAVQEGVLHEDNRVFLLQGVSKQAQGVVGCGRDRHAKARHRGEPSLQALRVGSSHRSAAPKIGGSRFR